MAPAQIANPPVLAIGRLGSINVALSWSNVAPGFVLQGLSNLNESSLWLGIPQAPVSQGNLLTVTQSVVVASGEARFFRLAAKGSPSGIDYLQARQNTDGSWGNTSQTRFRDTAGVLEALALFGQTDTASFAAGLSALASISPRNNDDTSRQTIALALGGVDVSTSAANLLSSQNLEIFDLLNTNYPGRGWGLASGFGNSTLDTALVLRALKAGGKAGGLSVVRETLAGLATSPAHAFEVPAGSSGLALKVRKLSGTVRFRITYPDNSSSFVDLSGPSAIGFPTIVGVATLTAQNLTASAATYTAEIGFTGPDGFDAFRIATALTYLGLTQNPDGGWGIGPGEDSHLLVTAEAVRALAAWGLAFAPPQSLQSAKAWLLARQNPDGGFSSVPGTSNLPETCLAVLAILSIDPTTPLSPAVSFLRNTQLADGSWGGNAYQTAQAIQAVRMPPVVSPIPGQSVISPYPFAPITLDNFVKDPDDPISQIAWSVTGNSLLSVDISNRVATISYLAGTNNPSITEQLTFIATDPSGQSSSATATYIVSSNRPPVMSQIPGQSVGAPHPFAQIYLDNYVMDPDESTNQLTWTVTGNTQLAVGISNRVVTIAYPPNITVPITEQLMFTATDPAGLSASTTATFSVAPDQPPIVSAIQSQTVFAPYGFAPINLDNYVADPDDPDSAIAWQITGNLRLTVTLSNRVALITYAANPATNISEQLTFTATDPVGKFASTSATFTVNSNRPPVVSTIPGQTIYAPYGFSPIALDNYVSDADESVTQMTWQVTGNVRLTVTLSNRVASITYPGNLSSNLTEVLAFKATDPVGLFNSTTASFTVNSNRPPVVNLIPAQTNLVPVPFAAISLDNYVSDPGDSPTQMTWSVTGNVKLTVTLSNRVATITYPTDTTNSINELLTFRATDPSGLSGSNTVWFSAIYTPPDYTIPRGGSTNDHRIFSTSVAAWNQYDYVTTAITNNPAPVVTYTNLSAADVPPVSVQMNYRISAATNAALGTYPMSVEYRLYDVNNNPLGPLTNSYYLFRIKVTP